MALVERLERARAAYERRAWGDAYADLRAADELDPLGAPDLQKLGFAAFLTGRDDTAVETLERAHHALLAGGEVPAAVRAAFWIGINLLQRGQHAPGGGWIARGARLLDEASLDCVERGYMLSPRALQALETGNPSGSLSMFEEVSRIADRFRDPDLMALGRLGRGRAHVRLGDTALGVEMLDDAMVAVTTGDVSPIAAGIVYCAVIITCREMFDVRRAQQWTAALSDWCDSQQDLRPYRGQCLVHRSEVMQFRGRWSDAMEEVQHACAHLSDPPGDPVLGMAQYQRAELLRLQGAYDRAEEAYRQASRSGHTVQPGLALLRLAQGRLHDAGAAIRRAAGEAEFPVERARVLAAFVEITAAAGDVEVAGAAVEELAELAAGFDSPFLRAVEACARGEVMLAGGDPGNACSALRGALRAWQELGAPYEAARVRVLLAKGCASLGDHDTAAIELDASRAVFVDLRAAPALAEVDELSGAPSPPALAGLTPREVEVLRLVATGVTNREIADQLVISEKTVARHLTNTFNKLGVASRAAATAYAYDHGLIARQ